MTLEISARSAAQELLRSLDHAAYPREDLDIEMVRIVAEAVLRPTPQPLLGEQEREALFSQAFHDYFHKVRAEVGHDAWLRICRHVFDRVDAAVRAHADSVALAGEGPL